MKPVYAKPIKFVPIKKSQLHESVRGVNLKLYNAAMKAIADEPSQFDMNWWHGESIVDPRTKGSLKPPNCGTTACFGGWALALQRKKSPKANEKVCRRSPIPTDRLAALVLKLPLDHAASLFVHERWPYGWGYKYDDFRGAGHHRRAAQLALKRFKHYLLTGQ